MAQLTVKPSDGSCHDTVLSLAHLLPLWPNLLPPHQTTQVTTTLRRRTPFAAAQLLFLAAAAAGDSPLPHIFSTDQPGGESEAQVFSQTNYG